MKVKYSVFIFISTKVFVHLNNLKLFYRGIKYLKFIVCLFHYIKKLQKYTFQTFIVNVVNMNGSNNL